MAGTSHSAMLEQLCRNKAAGMDAFSYFQLAAAVDTGTKTVARIVKDWEKQGLVTCLGKGPKNRLQYRISEYGKARFKPAQKRISQTPEGNMWTAMRQLKVFTPIDVAINARTEAINITDDDARAFCRFLAKGEQPYLRVKQTAIPGRREAAYQLIRNTGPKPPRECRVRATFDANLGAFTYIPEPQQ